MKTKRTLVLAGHFTGKNIVLYGVQFRGGRATLTESESSLDGLVNILGKCYQAYEEGSDILKAAQERDRKNQERNHGHIHPEAASQQGSGDGLPGGVHPPGADSGGEKTPEGPADVGTEPGGSGLPSNGDGHGSEDTPAPETDFTAILIEAVKSLDPENDNLWTELGEPKIEAINAALPPSLKVDKRGTIESLVPGYTREVALAERRKNG